VAHSRGGLQALPMPGGSEPGILQAVTFGRILRAKRLEPVGAETIPEGFKVPQEEM
jgi:hypothetical protein